jgi:hypothetical protein
MCGFVFIDQPGPIPATSVGQCNHHNFIFVTFTQMFKFADQPGPIPPSSTDSCNLFKTIIILNIFQINRLFTVVDTPAPVPSGMYGGNSCKSNVHVSQISIFSNL